jgi:pilus assembly protein Flp/PilA
MTRSPLTCKGWQLIAAYFHTLSLEKTSMTKLLARIVREEEGASLAEYGLLLALIAIACIVSIVALGGSVSTMFKNIAASI